MKKLLLILIAVIVCAGSAAAQDKIDKLVEWLERQKSVSTVYTEKRDPKTHKVYRTTRVLTVTKLDHIKDIERIFENERPNSIEATKSADGVFVLKFLKNNSYRVYKFVWPQRGSSAVLSVSIREKDAADNGETSWTGVIDDFDGMLLSGLGDDVVICSSLPPEALYDTDATRLAIELAEDARQQAQAAREQAEMARKQADKARRHARQSKSKGSKNTSDTGSHVVLSVSAYAEI